MSILRALWHLLDSRQRRHLLGLQLLSIVMALSTVGGVASVLPFFAALSDPHTIQHNAVAWGLLQKLSVGEGSIVPALGAAFAASVLIANAINLFGLLAINRFSVRVGETLYAALFAEYLRRGYEFHVRCGSSVLASRVQESARVTSGIVQYALILVANLVTIAFIVAAVVFIDPFVAVASMAGLGASYATLYAVSCSASGAMGNPNTNSAPSGCERSARALAQSKTSRCWAYRISSPRGSSSSRATFRARVPALSPSRKAPNTCSSASRSSAW